MGFHSGSHVGPFRLAPQVLPTLSAASGGSREPRSQRVGSMQ